MRELIRIAQPGARIEEVAGDLGDVDDLVVVRRQVRQIETRDTKINDMMFHAITAHDTAQKRHLALVVNNQAEPVAGFAKSGQTPPRDEEPREESTSK